MVSASINRIQYFSRNIVTKYYEAYVKIIDFDIFNLKYDVKENFNLASKLQMVNGLEGIILLLS